jgi:hypothetical protein
VQLAAEFFLELKVGLAARSKPQKRSIFIQKKNYRKTLLPHVEQQKLAAVKAKCLIMRAAGGEKVSETEQLEYGEDV